jgi:hypothetical protein
MNTLLRLALAATLVPTALACSGGDSTTGTSSTASTGLPKEKKLSAITDAEAQAACAAATRPFSASEEKNFSCNTGGVFAVALSGAKTDADAQKACKAAFDECIAKPYTPDVNDCTKEKVPTNFKNCDALVSEYDACYAEQIAALRSTFASASYCSSIKLGQADEKPGPACAALEQKCPDILNDSNP